MRTPRRIFFLLIIVVLSSVPAGWAQATQYDGTWSGTTAQPTKTISLEVSGGSIRKFIITARVEAVGCSSNISETINTTVPIGSNGSFSYQSSAGTPISWTIAGTFSSNSAASGTINVRVNFIPVPGACLGTANTTWTASKSGTPGPGPDPGPGPGGSWKTQTSTVTSSLGGVDFASDLLGLVSGGSATVLRTVNGGETWTRVSLGTVATDRCCYNVRFASPTVAWVVGIRSVLRSTDGGQTFIGAQFTDSPFRTSIHPVSNDVAWAVGGDSGMRIHYRYTFSGGGSTLTSRFWVVTSQDFMRDIFFVNESTGWSVGSPGRIIKITNAHDDPLFTIQQSGTTVMLHGIFMLDQDRGWAVGDNGTILRTTNGGTTWSAQFSGTTNALQKVAFRDPLNGFIVGAAGIILTTSDGGATWKTDPSGTSSDLRHIFLESSAYAVGANGTILKKSGVAKRKRGVRRGS